MGVPVKNGAEFVLALDSVEEGLLGALARQNGISIEEQAKRIVRAALDEAARNAMRPCHEVKKH